MWFGLLASNDLVAEGNRRTRADDRLRFFDSSSKLVGMHFSERRPLVKHSRLLLDLPF